MITPMTKYSFILLNGEQGDLLERLQEVGLVDITRSIKPIDDTSHNIKAEIELLDGLIQGLQKADIPEGTEREFIDGDIVRLAGGMLMRYGVISTTESLRNWPSLAFPCISTSFQAKRINRNGPRNMPSRKSPIPNPRFCLW